MQATVGTEPTKLVAAPEISTAQKTCHAHPLSHRRPARVKATGWARQSASRGERRCGPEHVRLIGCWRALRPRRVREDECHSIIRRPSTVRAAWRRVFPDVDQAEEHEEAGATL